MLHTKFCRHLIAWLLVIPAAVSANLEFESWTTPNGARVYLVQQNALPMVDIRVVFDAGSARDDGAAGIATLTNSLLDEGAGGLTAQQLAEAFESVGAQTSLDALRDMASVGVRSLSDEKYLDSALRHFKKILTQPDFPQTAFDRQLARFKIAVKSREQSPADIADETFYKALYGDHPYATPSAGTTESLNTITRDAVAAFYKRYYVASNAVIAIVGDVDRKQAEDLVNQLVSGLDGGEKAPALPEVPRLEQAQTIYVDYPSAQSHIFIGQPGVKRGQDKYFDLYVANHPFGGSGFASRLVETVREENGLAYSVYSYFSPMRVAGPFIMGMQTRNDQVGKALDLLDKELRKYVDEGAEKQELQDSISNITGSFPLNLDSNSKLLSYIAMMGFYNLPTDYLDTYLDNVRAVTTDSARAAFAEMINPDKLVTVIVGQREQMQVASDPDATASTPD